MTTGGRGSGPGIDTDTDTDTGSGGNGTVSPGEFDDVDIEAPGRAGRAAPAVLDAIGVPLAAAPPIVGASRTAVELGDGIGFDRAGTERAMIGGLVGAGAARRSEEPPNTGAGDQGSGRATRPTRVSSAVVRATAVTRNGRTLSRTTVQVCPHVQPDSAAREWAGEKRSLATTSCQSH